MKEADFRPAGHPDQAARREDGRKMQFLNCSQFTTIIFNRKNKVITTGAIHRPTAKRGPEAARKTAGIQWITRFFLFIRLSFLVLFFGDYFCAVFGEQSDKLQKSFKMMCVSYITFKT